MYDLFFENEKNAIKVFFHSLDKSLEFDEHVYHYTSLEALSNIIKSNELWFSDINSLNDLNEIGFGLKCLEAFINKNDGISDKKNIINLIQECSNIHKNNDSNIYTFSTSANNNSLPMWLIYSQYAKGLNFKIKRKELFELLSRGNESFGYVYPVIYCNKTDYSILQENQTYTKTFQEQMPKLFENLIQKFPNSLGNSNINSLILILASMFKTDDFKFEEEWRYFIILKEPQNNITSILNNNTIKYFFKLKLENIDEIIAGIGIGPNICNNTLEPSINKFLALHNIKIRPTNEGFNIR